MIPHLQHLTVICQNIFGARSSLHGKLAFTFIVSILAIGVGFLNQILISGRFGTTQSLDSYWAALALLGILSFYSHPLRDAVTPAFSALLKNKYRASKYAGSALSLALILGVIGFILIGLMAFIEPVKFYAQTIGIDSAIAEMLFWLAPSLVFVGASELLIGLMSALNLVKSQAICRIIPTLSTCLFLISMSGQIGIYALPLAISIAYIGCILFVLYMLIKNNISIYPGNPMRAITNNNRNMFLSLVFIYSIAQANVVVERLVFVDFGTGILSSYQYAVTLVGILIGLISGPLCSVLWPKFMEMKDDNENIKKILNNLLIFIFIPLCFICIFLYINATSIIHIIYSRGVFNSESALLTSTAFCIVIFTAIPATIHQIIGRLLNAQNRSRAILISSLMMAFTSISILIMGKMIGNYKLAMTHWFFGNFAAAFFSTYFAYKQYFHRQSFYSYNIFKIPIKILFLFLIAFIFLPIISIQDSKMYTLLNLFIEFIIYAFLFSACIFYILQGSKKSQTTEGGNL